MFKFIQTFKKKTLSNSFPNCVYFFKYTVMIVFDVALKQSRF